jgi:hypothetical protein
LDYYSYVFFPEVHAYCGDSVLAEAEFGSSITLAITVKVYVQYYDYGYIDNDDITYKTLLALPLDDEITSNYARYSSTSRP